LQESHFYDLVNIKLTIGLDNNLEVSFSRVTYQDIAPKIGLEPYVDGEDIPTFPMFRARITNDLFCKIMEDIQAFTFQYRPLVKQDTEEDRSRFLSAVNTDIQESIAEEPTTNHYLIFIPSSLIKLSPYFMACCTTP
jgi:hypothetical protein